MPGFHIKNHSSRFRKIINQKNTPMKKGWIVLIVLTLGLSCRPGRNDEGFSGNSGTFKDLRDGQEYQWIRVGDQIWMAENLRYDCGHLVTRDEEWKGLTPEAKACCWPNNDNTMDNYGMLYTYAAALEACPAGWHLPTDEEWAGLVKFVEKDGHKGQVATALKSAESWAWESYEGENGEEGGNGDDDYGFNALPAGCRYSSNGSFQDLGYLAYWWTATPDGEGAAMARVMANNPEEIRGLERDIYDRTRGLSVRCIKDAPDQTK